MDEVDFTVVEGGISDGLDTAIVCGTFIRGDTTVETTGGGAGEATGTTVEATGEAIGCPRKAASMSAALAKRSRG